MWVKKEMPWIPGYANLGDNVAAKGWLDFRLDELLDDAPPVHDCLEHLENRRDVCDFVISSIQYPLHRGVPSDKHKNNWFDGACCHQITHDYWQSASETLRTLHLNRTVGIGDCEDTSFLIADLFRLKGWEYWMIIGYVYQGNELLGGHGWALLQTESNDWILYESTLETPPVYPGGYPYGHPDATEWYIENLTYKALVKMQKGEYYENSDTPQPLNLNAAGDYLKQDIRSKESKKKHIAISRAWGIKTKPLTQANLLSRLLWR